MAGATLNPEEINALMSAIEDGQVAGEEPKSRGSAVAYDLTSQDRVIRGQMPTLDAINEHIASMFAMGIAGRTRLSVQVSSGPASLLRFADFNSMLAPPSTVCVMNLGKGGAQALLVMEPGLADAMIAAALGDKQGRGDEIPSAAVAQVRRELTVVERNVLRRLLSLLTDAMAAAWAPVLRFKPEVSRFESDPRLAVIAPLNEAAVLCPLELDGAIRGLMQLALPYTAIEPVKKALMSPPQSSSPRDARFAKRLVEEVNQVRVELRVALGCAHSSLRKLTEFEVGDVITLGTSEGASLPVFVQGRAKFTGKPKVAGGALCLEIDSGPLAEIRKPFEQHPPHNADALTDAVTDTAA